LTGAFGSLIVIIAAETRLLDQVIFYNGFIWNINVNSFNFFEECFEFLEYWNPREIWETLIDGLLW
jgi:hypothetical protein